MPNVIPFRLRRDKTAAADAAPRHRRAGHFDEQDTWHDDESESAVVTDATSG